MPETLHETLAALLAHLEGEDITSSYEERYIFTCQSVHLARKALQQAQAEDTPYRRTVLATARDYRKIAAEVYALLASGRRIEPSERFQAQSRRRDAEIALLREAIYPEEAADAG